jgi:putative chitinase
MNIIDIIIERVRKDGAKFGWSKLEMAQFLAQVEHESGSFRATKELGYGPERAYQIFPKRFGTVARAREIFRQSGSAGLFEVMYTGKIGNNRPGDGAKYIGRGYIQITGKANYELIKEKTGIDVVTYPELLEKPDMAILASMVWWNVNVHNRITDFSNTSEVTRLVNGPRRLGLEDRIKKFNKWKKII